VSGSYNSSVAFPDGTNNQYLIFDHDAKVGTTVLDFLDSGRISRVRTSYRSSWQNGVAGRWVRSFRNEVLDHVIVLNENRLRRLARDYLCYYHQDRTSDSLNKDVPAKRPALDRNTDEQLQSMPRPGDLHHRYFLGKSCMSTAHAILATYWSRAQHALPTDGPLER
jgi:hypothetical protein